MPTSADEFDLPVRSYEIDAYRHVNNGAYLSWFEDARERFLRAEGRDYMFYPEHDQAWIMVVKLDVDFLAAARAGQTLHCRTRLVKLGRSSVVFRQSLRDLETAKVFCRARVIMAFGDGAESSVAIPDDFREHYDVDAGGDLWQKDEGGERSTSPSPQT
ncbi:MAG: acyl-CoA thioesterase [Planctomycetota bacterium]